MVVNKLRYLCWVTTRTAKHNTFGPIRTNTQIHSHTRSRAQLITLPACGCVSGAEVAVAAPLSTPLTPS